MVLPLGTCHRRVPRDFIKSFIAPKRLIWSGPVRCHSTHFNDRNIAKSIESYSMPRATCHWHVVRVLTLLFIYFIYFLLSPAGFPSNWRSLTTKQHNLMLHMIYIIKINEQKKHTSRVVKTPSYASRDTNKKGNINKNRYMIQIKSSLKRWSTKMVWILKNKHTFVTNEHDTDS